MRFTGRIPADHHATLFVVENGTPQVLHRFEPRPAELPFAYPEGVTEMKVKYLPLTPPAGVLAFLLVTSPAGPVTPEQVRLPSGKPWSFPDDRGMLFAGGKVWIEEKIRGVGAAVEREDPRAAVESQLIEVAGTLPAGAAVEGVSFVVKPR